MSVHILAQLPIEKSFVQDIDSTDIFGTNKLRVRAKKDQVTVVSTELSSSSSSSEQVGEAW